MVLWLIFVLMTAVAVSAVWWPLARQQKPARAGSEIEVYRDQIDEIARDQAASLIGKAEAEAARVEISRRLIAAAEAAKASVGGALAPAKMCRQATLVASIFFLPLFAGTIYLALGSPNLMPISMNAAVEARQIPNEISNAVTEVESYLKANPRDGRAWELLAPVYLRLGRFDDAVRARRNALEIFGPDAARLGDLGEAMVITANGVVTPEAKSLFERANKDDPKDVMAQYYLGLSAKQEGRRDDAYKQWTALVSTAPEGAAWLPLVKSALARIDEKDPPVTVAPSAATATPDHSGATIEAMVERLAERLKKDGSDVPGWIQLVRSYRVLGKADKADAAIADARATLGSNSGANSGALARFEQGLQELQGGVNRDAPASGVGGDASSPAGVASPSPSPSSSPSADQVAAADQMAPAERNAMIEGMVARLAQRLSENGSDVDGWLRLIKAYSVLGERDKALTATANARSALAGNSENLRRIGELAKELGLEG